jgi:hypothetical protein
MNSLGWARQDILVILIVMISIVPLVMILALGVYLLVEYLASAFE